MSYAPLRFLHASDFRLDVPVGGIAEVPEHLRDRFLDAPYHAARRVFDAALAEEVDFVLLSGGLVHARRSGPRGPAFLVEQFERLQARGISVYWAGGPADRPDAWPAAARLPENVVHFPSGAAARHVVLRDNQALALVVGRSHAGWRKIEPGDFVADHSAPYAIAVAHGIGDARPLAARGFQYWALGGRPRRGTAGGAAHRLHYPGSPQGRSPDEAGPHGATTVRIDTEGRTHLNFVATDVLRWRDERVLIDGSESRAELERRLRERVAVAAEEAGAIDLLISWTLVGSAAAWSALRRVLRPAELLDWLRRELGAGAPARWSVALDLETTDVAAADLAEQETILGDFLHEVRRHTNDGTLPIDMATYLSPRHAEGPLAELAGVTDASERRRVLQEVAVLGIELLGGEEVEP